MTGSPTERSIVLRHHALHIGDAHVALATFERPGRGDPIVFLHGLGTTKEDFADAAFRPVLRDRPLIALDFPGFGETLCSDIAAVDIPFLVETAATLLARMGIAQCCLVGHSMGGLVAQLLAERLCPGVRAVVSIEGNMTPEDCLFSRCVERFGNDADGLLCALFERARAASIPGASLYAVGLRHKLDAAVLPELLASLVRISDSPGLIDRFAALSCPRTLLVGQASATKLTYLEWLREGSVPVRLIADSGHFPMYSNPPAMWATIEAVLGLTGTNANPAERNAP